MIAEGDRVCVRFRLTGTNTGHFMDMPATGKPIKVDALALMTVSSGKVAEVPGQFDQTRWGRAANKCARRPVGAPLSALGAPARGSSLRFSSRRTAAVGTERDWLSVSSHCVALPPLRPKRSSPLMPLALAL